jgi:hypothetical protein
MDVADILGYKDTEAMTRKLDEDEVQNLRSVGSELQNVGFNNRGVNLINESGLYSAIMTSQKPEAKTFKRWIFYEVLPAIRKTGSYIDTGRKLTTLSHEEIYRNLADQAAAMRKALPGMRITDDCNLLISDSGKPKDKVSYYREMDKLNLPSIVVVEKKPIKVIFDWIEYQKHDPELIKKLYKELGALCAGRQSMSDYCKAKPFEMSGSLEELTGFQTVLEAQRLAKAMRELVVDTVRH